jgi:A/G-specific adenine glycosylase
MPEASPEPFAERLLAWWRTHGRHDLPWQRQRTPYRVWVAEIMLQQTQVATVIPYFERFMAAFPDLEALARAPVDAVLAHWSGLGYYARARNLHAAAERCLAEHGGELPSDPETLETLPGIGRSTANAIVAQVHDRRAPILDGNVKRVLARHAGIEGWPGRSAVLRALWAEAEARTPLDRAADYTQAIMDLGATVCTPRQPACTDCPVAVDCLARRQQRTARLPTPRPKRKRPVRSTTMLILENPHGELLLERRPPSGVWGGLWSLPELGETHLPDGDERPAPEPLRHQFTHFTLDIRFRRLQIPAQSRLADDDRRLWIAPARAASMGLPRPIRDVVTWLEAQSQPDRRNQHRNGPRR